jgi:hypothetical protein
MMGCDYNGWNDVPEDEREAIDAFEAANGTHSRGVVSLWRAVVGLISPISIAPPQVTSRTVPKRKAA